mgnify:CR=1 FL=1
MASNSGLTGPAVNVAPPNGMDNVGSLVQNTDKPSGLQTAAIACSAILTFLAGATTCVISYTALFGKAPFVESASSLAVALTVLAIGLLLGVYGIGLSYNPNDGVNAIMADIAYICLVLAVGLFGYSKYNDYRKKNSEEKNSQ